MPIAARQKRGHYLNLFSVHYSEGNIFHVTSETLFKELSRTNCEKTSSHLGSEQRFIVNCFKLSFQFSITSDLKRNGNGTATHVANNDFCKSSLQTVVRFEIKQVLVLITTV